MNYSRNAYLLLATVAVGVILAWLIIPGDDPEDPISPQRAEQAREVLLGWLECEECEEQQLEAVLQQGDLLQPLLIATLNRGLSPASREVYSRFLQGRHAKLLEYHKTHPSAVPVPDIDDYVAGHVARLDLRYRVRAAQALHQLGSRQARQALETIRMSTQSEPLRLSLKQLQSTSN